MHATLAAHICRDRRNRMRLLIPLFCLAIFMSACSPDQNKTPKVAEGARQALDKSRAVDATVQQSADAARQSIDEQTQ
jgi:hypothetical protein